MACYHPVPQCGQEVFVVSTTGSTPACVSPIGGGVTCHMDRDSYEYSSPDGMSCLGDSRLVPTTPPVLLK